jgi:hypothetical protein
MDELPYVFVCMSLLYFTYPLTTILSYLDISKLEGLESYKI